MIFTLRREQGRLARIAAGAVRRSSAALGCGDLAARSGADLSRNRVSETRRASNSSGWRRTTSRRFHATDDGTSAWSTSARSAPHLAMRPGPRRCIGYCCPHAGRNLVLGGGLVCCGSADRYLGLLCATMSRWTEAERHFEAALAMNLRIGAHAPLAHTGTTMPPCCSPATRPATGSARPRCCASLGERPRPGHAWAGGACRGTADASVRRFDGPAAIDDLTSREIEVLRPDRHRPEQCRHRHGAGDQPQHRGDACAQHSRQDRLRQPHRGGGLRDAARPGGCRCRADSGSSLLTSPRRSGVTRFICSSDLPGYPGLPTVSAPAHH